MLLHVLLPMLLGGVAAAALAQDRPASAHASMPSARERMAALAGTADGLVQSLKNPQVQASNFRIQVALYRESLRELMLADQQAAAPARLPRPALMELVRMAALLQSAANCETGRYLACPADLMERLVQQQKTVAGAVGASAHSD